MGAGVSGFFSVKGGGIAMAFDTRDFERRMTQIERSQLPQATVWALNDTAKDVLEHVQHEMDVVFDRPTRFTKNAFMVWRATKRTLVAEVKERPSVGKRHYLKRQERGGARSQTGLERMVSANLAYDGVLAAIIPTSAARKNAFGNWAPAERKQAVSALKAVGSAGYMAAAVAKSKAGASRRRATYFVPQKGSRMSPGIWRRKGRGKREKVEKIAHFASSAPVYEKRLGFYEGAQDVFERRIAPNFWKSFEKAMATRK